MTKPTTFWVEALQREGVPCSRLQDYAQVFNDPQLMTRNYFIDASHAKCGPVRQLGSPMRFSATPLDIKRSGPLLGEDSNSILSELGLDDMTIANLAGRNIVKTPALARSSPRTTPRIGSRSRARSCRM